MITISLFPGRYVQGYQAFARVGPELARLGQKAFAIFSPSALTLLEADLKTSTDGVIEVVTERFQRECCESEIERLLEQARRSGCDLIVGVGGGKTIDTSKIVADRLQAPVAIVPTIASTDAPCSACAVVYNEAGAVQYAVSTRRNPDLVLVDTAVIAQAPVRFLVSGMGDALATWFEAESCKRSGSNNEAGGKGSMTAYALARLCYDTLLEYGLAAKVACEAGAVTPALEHIVEANTLLSGLGFESGGLATAHSIHNGLTALPPTRAYYHGEKVAIGVLTSLFLTDKPKALIDEVYTFCESVGLPTTLADIGLADWSDDQLRPAAERACIPEEFIHREATEITPQAILFALKTANGEGMRRKGGKE